MFTILYTVIKTVRTSYHPTWFTVPTSHRYRSRSQYCLLMCCWCYKPSRLYLPLQFTTWLNCSTSFGPAI